MDTFLINGGQPFVGSRAAEIGLKAVDVRALLATHRLRRVLRGVYVDTSMADSRALRAKALHLVRPPGAVFFGTTVAFLIGVDAFAPKDRFDFVPQCVVPHHWGRCKQAAVRCREGYLPEADLTQVDGLVVTNAVRTTADILRSLWRPNAMAAADAMAHAGFVTREEVMSYIAKKKRYPGIVQARALAAMIEPLTESPGESWQRLRLVDAGFPVPKPQVSVFDRFDRIVSTLDHAYEDAKVGIEYDGREFHEDDIAEKYDGSKRGYLCNTLRWRLSVAKKERIFGDDPAFEQEIGEWIGITPLPRRWLNVGRSTEAGGSSVKIGGWSAGSGGWSAGRDTSRECVTLEPCLCQWMEQRGSGDSIQRKASLIVHTANGVSILCQEQADAGVLRWQVGGAQIPHLRNRFTLRSGPARGCAQASRTRDRGCEVLGRGAR